MSGVPGPIRWRCRRGMQELDLLLARWLAAAWPGATMAARAAFARLLEEPDTRLAAWLLQGERPEDHTLAQLVDDILRRPA